MAFIVTCTNKGCFEQNTPALDSNNCVICGECGKEIANISDFTKRQMKSMGQVVKDSKKQYSFKCVKCSKSEQPKIVNNKFLCKFCDNEFTNISEPFKLIMKDKLNEKNSNNK